MSIFKESTYNIIPFQYLSILVKMEENDKVASPTFGPGNVGLNKLIHNYSLRIVNAL